MPTFANPLGLLALFGIPALLAIHFLQRKARVLTVSTLFLLDHTRREAPYTFSRGHDAGLHNPSTLRFVRFMCSHSNRGLLPAGQTPDTCYKKLHESSTSYLAPTH